MISSNRSFFASTRNRWLLGVLLLGVVLGWMALRPNAKNAQVVTVQRTNLTQSVVATGRVNAHVRVDLGSEVTATVQTVAVSEGDRVKTGDLLVQLLTQRYRVEVIDDEIDLRPLVRPRAPLLPAR